MKKRLKNRIKFLRISEEFNLTQQELADKLGISRVYLSEIENGRVPSSDIVLKLSNVFNKDARDIFFTDGVVWSLQNVQQDNEEVKTWKTSHLRKP